MRGIALVAQVPSATEAQLTGWILGFGGVMGLVLLGLSVAKAIKDLFTRPPPPPPDQEYVTRHELTELKADVLAKIASLDSYTRTELEAMKTDLGCRVDKLETYLHESSHRSANAQQNLLLKVERLITYQEMTLSKARRIDPRKIVAPEADSKE